MVSTRRKGKPGNNAVESIAENSKTNVNVKVIKNENHEGVITMESKGRYEDLREQRIKENKERMEKLGILQLSLNLNSKVGTTKKTTSSEKRMPDLLPLPASPPRRSSRLKIMTPVNYSEMMPKKKRRSSEVLEIWIQEGSKPEIYTEEHEKLLGDCKMGWTLFVDGYGKDGKRIYDPEMGETCHQCRQKTLGRHTHCSKCDLVQGQFCGDCLYLRYGENVMEVNKNPDWICPVCRGICNCSLCRKARGWTPTGAIYRKVKKLGFKSVAHYLIQTQREQIHSQDSGVANLDSEVRETASAEKRSDLCINDESLCEDEHQDTFADLQSDDNEIEMEEEEKQELCSDISDGYDDGNGDNPIDNGNGWKEKIETNRVDGASDNDYEREENVEDTSI